MLSGAMKNCSTHLGVRGIGEIFRAMGPLILIARICSCNAGFFNVGLPGQALAGRVMAAVCSVFPQICHDH